MEKATERECICYNNTCVSPCELHNKTLQARWLTEQEFTSHSYKSWEVQDQDTGKFGV